MVCHASLAICLQNLNTESLCSTHRLQILFFKVSLLLFSSSLFLFSPPSLKWKCLVTQSCPTLCDPMDFSPPHTSLSIEFARQEYWSGFTFSSPEDLPDPGVEPGFPALQADSLLWAIREALSSVQFSRSVMSDSVTPWTTACQAPLYITNSWSLLKLMSIQPVMPPTISSSVVPFSSCLQSFPALESFPLSHFFASGGQNIGVSASASVLAMNIQDWFPLWLTGLNLQSKGLSRVFSNTTVENHQFFGVQLSLWSNSHSHTWLLKKP